MSIPPTPQSRARLVVLVSGVGTNLQALIDAEDFADIEIVAVGADRYGIEGLRRAEAEAIPIFVVPVEDFSSRADWDSALALAIAEHEPDLVVSAGFMKILGDQVLARFSVINTHPALLPRFPGAHAVADALAAGVAETGCTVHFVDEGVDTGPIIEQRSLSVEAGDDVESLHERIKVIERELLVQVVRQLCRSGWSIEGREVVSS